MKKYYYLNIDFAKKGIAVIADIGNKRIDHLYTDDSFCEYVADHIPTYITYDENASCIRESSLSELVSKGIRELSDNQAIVNGDIVTYNKTFEYVKNGKIVKKTREMLVVEGIEQPFEDEIVVNGELIKIPKQPKDMIKPIFNKEKLIWEESATLEEKSIFLKEKCKDFSSGLIVLEKAGLEGDAEYMLIKAELDKCKEKYMSVNHELALEMNKTF